MFSLVSKTVPDGYTTEYTYNILDLVISINYNHAKEVSYRYNATGDIVSMTGWLGTTFELDLLHQITATADHKGNCVEYTYAGVSNQTSIAYPDGTTATYYYDLMKKLSKMAEGDSSETSCVYFGMGRATEINQIIAYKHKLGGKNMRFRDERKVFKEILNYPSESIPTIFSVKDSGNIYTFFENAHPAHYITVEKTKGGSFWVPVNADFDFDRPAGSNNYRELIQVARHLVKAFGLELPW